MLHADSSWTRFVFVFVVAGLVASLASGCTQRAKAKTAPENPPLDMPAPPPRDVEANDVTAPPPVPLPQEPARSAPPRPRPVPTTREPARPEPPRPEPPKAAEPPVEPPKPPTIDESPRPTILQTAPAGEESELERTVRATLSRATTDLNRVDYRTLNADARAQYDTAKRFIRQSEDAVRAKNMLFAKTVADKAAAIGAQLAGR